MRGSICIMGPLLGRLKKATVSLPGGCVIGARPINLHLKGFEALGAKIRIESVYVEASAKKLTGAATFLGGRAGSTVLGTANVMMAAALLAKLDALAESLTEIEPFWPPTDSTTFWPRECAVTMSALNCASL